MRDLAPSHRWNSREKPSRNSKRAKNKWSNASRGLGLCDFSTEGDFASGDGSTGGGTLDRANRQRAEFFFKEDFRFQGFSRRDRREDAKLVDAGEEDRRGGIFAITHQQHPGGLGGTFHDQHGGHERIPWKMIGKKSRRGIEKFPSHSFGWAGFFKPIDEAETGSVGRERLVGDHTRQAMGEK